MKVDDSAGVIGGGLRGGGQFGIKFIFVASVIGAIGFRHGHGHRDIHQQGIGFLIKISLILDLIAFRFIEPVQFIRKIRQQGVDGFCYGVHQGFHIFFRDVCNFNHAGFLFAVSDPADFRGKRVIDFFLDAGQSAPGGGGLQGRRIVLIFFRRGQRFHKSHKRVIRIGGQRGRDK